MERKQVICDGCGGRGHVTIWETTSYDEKTNIGTAASREVTCGLCKGKGWKEYAVFSIEEAEAILKHCGLEG